MREGWRYDVLDVRRPASRAGPCTGVALRTRPPEARGGGSVEARNVGGEVHTFSEVASFGGGCIDALNDLLGLTPVPSMQASRADSATAGATGRSAERDPSTWCPPLRVPDPSLDAHDRRRALTCLRPAACAQALTSAWHLAVAVERERAEDAVLDLRREELLDDRRACPVGAGDRVEEHLRRLSGLRGPTA